MKRLLVFLNIFCLLLLSSFFLEANAGLIPGTIKLSDVATHTDTCTKQPSTYVYSVSCDSDGGGCSRWPEGTGSVCGCQTYNSGTDCGACGTAVAGVPAVMSGSTVITPAIPPVCNTCSHSSFGCATYNTCRNSAFGACENTTATVTTYSESRTYYYPINRNFGYSIPSGRKLGVEAGKTCNINTDAIEQRRHSSSRYVQCRDNEGIVDTGASYYQIRGITGSCPTHRSTDELIDTFDQIGKRDRVPGVEELNGTCNVSGLYADIDDDKPNVSVSGNEVFKASSDNWCNFENFLAPNYGTSTNPNFDDCDFYGDPSEDLLKNLQFEIQDSLSGINNFTLDIGGCVLTYDFGFSIEDIIKSTTSASGINSGLTSTITVKYDEDTTYQNGSETIVIESLLRKAGTNRLDKKCLVDGGNYIKITATDNAASDSTGSSFGGNTAELDLSGQRVNVDNKDIAVQYTDDAGSNGQSRQTINGSLKINNDFGVGDKPSGCTISTSTVDCSSEFKPSNSYWLVNESTSYECGGFTVDGGESCQWECNSGYEKNGNQCDFTGNYDYARDTSGEWGSCQGDSQKYKIAVCKDGNTPVDTSNCNTSDLPANHIYDSDFDSVSIMVRKTCSCVVPESTSPLCTVSYYCADNTLLENPQRNELANLNIGGAVITHGSTVTIGSSNITFPSVYDVTRWDDLTYMCDDTAFVPLGDGFCTLDDKFTKKDDPRCGGDNTCFTIGEDLIGGSSYICDSSTPPTTSEPTCVANMGASCTRPGTCTGDRGTFELNGSCQYVQTDTQSDVYSFGYGADTGLNCDLASGLSVHPRWDNSTPDPSCGDQPHYYSEMIATRVYRAPYTGTINCTGACVEGAAPSCVSNQGDSCQKPGTCSGNKVRYDLNETTCEYEFGEDYGYSFAFTYGADTGRNCDVSSGMSVYNPGSPSISSTCGIASSYTEITSVKVHSAPSSGTIQCNGDCN